MLTVVVHDTEIPALYGAIAAAVAARDGARLMHPVACLDTTRYPDAIQHVLAAGGLAASGLYWAERLTGRPVSPSSDIDDIVHAALRDDVVVPVHPKIAGAASILDDLIAAAGDRDCPVRVHHVVQNGSLFSLTGDGVDDAATPIVWRDAYGRITPSPEDPQDGPGRKRPLTVGFIGSEQNQFEAYPATLAALADAADALDVSLTVRFIAPAALASEEGAACLDDISGLLLPGGSEMGNVAGQIRAAGLALERDIPTVGLCLGMQTMTTAFFRRFCGDGDADLAEANSHAGTLTFIPMDGAIAPNGDALPAHRTGDAPIDVAADTKLGAILAQASAAPVLVRCNHRYRLNPAVLGALTTAGLVIPASSFGGAVIDAIAYPAHPFFAGMQGHPELSSRRNVPSPLLVAFLESALAAATDNAGTPLR